MPVASSPGVPSGRFPTGQSRSGAAVPSVPGAVPSVPGSVESQEEVLPRQFGKYTLLRELASGGMAKVYLAIQRAVAGFEKLVVIKRILPELSRDPSFVEMLLSEARTAATLNHPNVVQTFDVGEYAGTYFIAMEHINGEDIRSIVRAMKRAGVTEFPVEHTLNIILGVCAGLAYAHEKRDLEGRSLEIVHRDISPQNILITFSGDVKIVDFGIAKSSEAAQSEKTMAGQLKGKVPYMSPEQAQGHPLDHRSDIFAVGIMLFELTTGRRLFKAKSEFETLKLICERDYPTPSRIRPGYPPELERIVMKALVKDPADRYQSARDMQADLEAFIRQERIAVSAVTLANWMKMLFEEKIAAQKEALQDVKQLADVIASQRATDTGVEMYAATTTGAATITGTDGAGYPARKGRGGLIVLAAVFVLALGGVAAFVTLKEDPKPAATAPTGTTPPPPEPEAKKGSVSIKSDPPGAYIRVAGELQSQKTPATVEKIPLDIEIEVKISMEGFEDHIAKINLSEDKLEDSVEVKMQKGSVTLVWKVNPVGGQLMIDGKKFEGEGNKVEGLSTGDHKLVFIASGHLPEVVKFSAKKGETKTIDITLRKGDPRKAITGGGSKDTEKPKPKATGSGTVMVNSRGGFCTNVTVGGRSAGPTPAVVSGVPAGPVGISCKLADGRSVGSGTTVKDGQTARVTISIPK
jgi:serine/threonine protein kinase